MKETGSRNLHDNEAFDLKFRTGTLLKQRTCSCALSAINRNLIRPRQILGGRMYPLTIAGLDAAMRELSR
jgi:hypothetical protein